MMSTVESATPASAAAEPSATDLRPFAGRWVLVSGASSGIGRAVCVMLAQQGAHLAMLGRDDARLQATRDLLPEGTRCVTRAVDLSKLDGITATVQSIAKEVGKLYGLVHAAGAVGMAPLTVSKPERVQALMNLNFGAGLELARALVRRDVLDAAGGSIVWVSSVTAHVGQPGQIAYAASKGAIKAAVRAMALELADRQVRVNAVSPGVVHTEMAAQTAATLGAEAWQRVLDMHPLGIGEPDDVARAVSFLLDPRNRWITGSDLVIDGGYTAH